MMVEQKYNIKLTVSDDTDATQKDTKFETDKITAVQTLLYLILSTRSPHGFLLSHFNNCHRYDPNFSNEYY